MISLTTQAQRRRVQRLSFCYLCGQQFAAGDTKNRDHVPPDSIFKADHKDPLILPTHVACNSRHALDDEKIAQLIALRYGKAPSNPKNRRLSVDPASGALTNLDIDGVVWRWISGFHAALYGEPATNIRYRCALVTPFPRGRIVNGKAEIEPLQPQHMVFVQAIKANRVRNNLDTIQCNKRTLTYECVWSQADNNGSWMCFFALDVYDWKDLGKAQGQNARGCAGFYILPSHAVPVGGAIGVKDLKGVGSKDPLDPFAP